MAYSHEANSPFAIAAGWPTVADANLARRPEEEEEQERALMDCVEADWPIQGSRNGGKAGVDGIQ